MFAIVNISTVNGCQNTLIIGLDVAPRKPERKAATGQSAEGSGPAMGARGGSLLIVPRLYTLGGKGLNLAE